MNNIKGFSQFVNEIINASYTQEWPLNKQEIGVNQNDVESDPDYAKKENKFQEVQDQMKIILKPMLLKKNPNANEHDVEKVSDSFFNLGGERAAQVKKMVDNCKDTKQCAQDIVNKYYKYVKINFGTKDNTNDVEQDSVMTSEQLNAEQRHWFDMWFKIAIEHLKKNQENRAIELIERLENTLFNRRPEFREERYFQNKINLLIAVAEKENCFNVRDFLTKYKNNNFHLNESVRNNTTNVCEECDGRGYTDKGRCKACNGTGLSRPRRKVKTGLVKIKKI